MICTSKSFKGWEKSYMSVVENIWGIIVLLSIIWVIYDLFTYNRAMSTLKKILWIIIVFLLGIIGAILYYLIGRRR
jgi:hypothetical protein